MSGEKVKEILLLLLYMVTHLYPNANSLKFSKPILDFNFSQKKTKSYLYFTSFRNVILNKPWAVKNNNIKILFPVLIKNSNICFLFLQVSNYQQKLKQLDGRQQELVRDNYELKDLCLYLDEERNCIDLNCPHCGEKILSRPNSVVPTEADEDEVMSKRLMDHKGKYLF